jgi:hypothetical protein
MIEKIRNREPMRTREAIKEKNANASKQSLRITDFGEAVMILIKQEEIIEKVDRRVADQKYRW